MSLRDACMTVRRDPALVSNAALAQAVETAGYRADTAQSEPATEMPRGLLARLLGR